MTENLDCTHVEVNMNEFIYLMNILDGNRDIVWKGGGRPSAVNKSAMFGGDSSIFVNLSNTGVLSFTRGKDFDDIDRFLGNTQGRVSLPQYLQLLEKKEIITGGIIKERGDKITSADLDLYYVRLGMPEFKGFMAFLEEKNKHIRWKSGYKPTEIPLREVHLTALTSVYVCVHSGNKLGYVRGDSFAAWNQKHGNKYTALELPEYISLLKSKKVISNNHCLTNKTITNHEIKFQNKRAFITGGNVPAGNCICGRRSKTSMELGCLSYSEAIGN